MNANDFSAIAHYRLCFGADRTGLASRPDDLIYLIILPPVVSSRLNVDLTSSRLDGCTSSKY